MIWLSIVLIYGFNAYGGQLDPSGLLKAKLFVFEPKAEAISGVDNCEDQLTQFIESLGHRIAEGSSSEWLGRAAEDAYYQAVKEQHGERIDRAGGSVEERRRRLLALIPPHKEYEPWRHATPESLKVDYVNYLVDEFARLEMTAIVIRALREVEHHYYPNERQPALEEYALPGDRGRSSRLIMFLRGMLPTISDEYEPAFQVFVDSLFTPAIVKASIAIGQLENTQELFLWLHLNNPLFYLHLFEKYHPYIREENLRQLPSSLSSSALIFSPPANPVSLPLVPMTR